MIEGLTPELALGLTLLLPGLGALVIGVADRFPNVRETASLLIATALCGTVVWLLMNYLAGATAQLRVVQMLPGLPISFFVEPIGLIFALVASALWIVITVYSIGYMRSKNYPHQTRFYICFALAMASTMGIAFAGNMITLFLFYEMLTLSTYPLVLHHETDAAKRGARIYISVLLTTSILFFLPAIVWTWWIAGTLDFTTGGILAGKIEGPQAAILFALYLFGAGKAALMPFHFWLPAAMVAPTPVSAFLHAVAVVKAGVFTVLKVGIYIFGVGFLSETHASEWMIWVAAASLIIASFVALRKDELKARLAYSTIAQLAYVTLGVSLASVMGMVGGVLQLVAHALGKITLFMCAGAIYVASGKRNISEMRGLGRLMPFTFGAFLLAALSIIGIPPSGGAWSKWFLMIGAADSGQQVMIGVWMLSSVLSVAYLIPVVARGFFLPLQGEKDRPQPQGQEVSTISQLRVREAPLWCVVPACITGVLSVLIYFVGPAIAEFVLPVLGP
ncbi:MAG: proton-conducting transporter transmembrane domain-containing protein [Alphaproteobacteria bacterium]